MGLNQSTHGTWNTNAICNLHLATGAICRPGSGPVLADRPAQRDGRPRDGLHGPGPAGPAVGARRRRPARSSRTSGTLAAGHAAHRRAGHGHRRHVRSGWPTGEIKACWIICTNPVASVANRSTVIAGPGGRRARHHPGRRSPTPRPTPTPTSCCPAAMWSESDGVMINSERNLTLVAAGRRPARRGPARTGSSSPRVACEMGFADGVRLRQSPRRSSRRSGAAANPATGYDLRGVTYDRLRASPVQWPAAPGRAGAATRSATATTA